MLVVLIFVGLVWAGLSLFSYIRNFEPDPLIYGLISVLFGVVLTGYIYNVTIPTIEDYRSGNYKTKITTEIIDGEVKSDTIYLKK